MPRVIPISDVATRPPQWLWRGRIPLGAITIIDGKPGSNKSTLLYDLAARVSTDRPMPGPQPSDQIHGSSALLFQGEDSVSRVRRQIEIAEGNVNRVFICVEDQDGPQDAPVRLPDSIAFLRREIRRCCARLVVFDPFALFMAGSMNSDRMVRRAMDPLNRLAEETQAAIVLVRHLRKSGASDALYAGVGSIAVVGASRSALMVGQHPADPALRVVAQFRSSFGPVSPSLQFMPVGEGDNVRINWRGPVCKCTARDLLDNDPDGGSALWDAMNFLLDALESGPRLVQDVKGAARNADIADRTLRRAKEKMGIQFHRDAFAAPGTWSLPQDNEMVLRLLELRQRPALMKLAERRRRRIDFIC